MSVSFKRCRRCVATPVGSVGKWVWWRGRTPTTVSARELSPTGTKERRAALSRAWSWSSEATAQPSSSTVRDRTRRGRLPLPPPFATVRAQPIKTPNENIYIWYTYVVWIAPLCALRNVVCRSVVLEFHCIAYVLIAEGFGLLLTRSNNYRGAPQNRLLCWVISSCSLSLPSNRLNISLQLTELFTIELINRVVW